VSQYKNAAVYSAVVNNGLEV